MVPYGGSLSAQQPLVYGRSVWLVRLSGLVVPEPTAHLNGERPTDLLPKELRSYRSAGF